MTITVSKEKSFFQRLPIVLQTQVARYLPKEDLADKARVSKAVKTVFENNQVWSEIAKKSNIPISDPKKSKQIVVTQLLEEVKKSNTYLIETVFNTEVVEQTKNKLLSISDPIEQRTELIKHLQMINLVRRRDIIKKILFGFDHGKHMMEAVKILLKSEVSFIPLDSKFVYIFLQFGENTDEEIFKAYISGRKATSPMLSIEIATAISRRCPKFLKLLLQEVKVVEEKYINLAMMYLVSAPDEEKAKIEEIWKLIFDKYSNDSKTQQRLTSQLSEMMKQHAEDKAKNPNYYEHL